MRCVLFVLLILFVSIAPSAMAENENAPAVLLKPSEVVARPTADEIDVWISELNALEFEKREEATRKLTDAGLIAAQPLLNAAKSCSLEASVRISAILRQWYTSEIEQLWEPTEAALEVLSQSKNRHIAKRSAATLDQFAFTLRQDRALAEIKKLGGSVKDVNNSRFRGGGEEIKSFMIVLGKDWKGGDDGLKFVRRVSGTMALYLMGNKATDKILTPGVTAEAVAALRRDMPQLMIAFRGPAFLGISPGGRTPGCRVDTVSPDSPADKAKILSGDIIAKFEGKPVADFDELVLLIQDKQPGDKVKLHVLRGDENDLIFLERLQAIKEPNPAREQLEKLLKQLTIEVEVTLAEWTAK